MIKTFKDPGMNLDLVVPPGFSKVRFRAYGAGGGSCNGNLGKKGRYATNTISVSPGESFLVHVGGDHGSVAVGGKSAGGWGGGASVVAKYNLSKDEYSIVCVAGGGGGGKESYNITGVEPVFYANGGRGGYAMCTLDVEEGDEFLFKVGDHSLVGPCGGGKGKILSDYECGDGGGGSIVAKRLTNNTSTVVCIAGGGGGGGGNTGDGGVGNSANAPSTYSSFNGEDGIGGSSSGTSSG